MAIFSHCQPWFWETAHQEQPFFPFPRFSHGKAALLFLVETKMVLPLTLTNHNYH